MTNEDIFKRMVDDAFLDGGVPAVMGEPLPSVLTLDGEVLDIKPGQTLTVVYNAKGKVSWTISDE